MRSYMTSEPEGTVAGASRTRFQPRPASMAAMAVAAVLVLLAGLLAIGQASARSAPSAVSPLSTQRGPDPPSG